MGSMLLNKDSSLTQKLAENPYMLKQSKQFLRKKGLLQKSHSHIPFALSNFGLGMYRMGSNTRDQELIKQAVDIGINVFDSSSNYLQGDSEITLGKGVLGLKVPESSSALLCSTKAGYIEAKKLAQLSRLEKENYYKISKISKTHWHSFDPKFLEQELRASALRLGFQPLGLFYLHNPEVILEKEGEPKL